MDAGEHYLHWVLGRMSPKGHLPRFYGRVFRYKTFPYRQVVEWSNTAVCKTVIHEFESRPAV